MLIGVVIQERSRQRPIASASEIRKGVPSPIEPALRVVVCTLGVWCERNDDDNHHHYRVRSGMIARGQERSDWTIVVWVLFDVAETLAWDVQQLLSWNHLPKRCSKRPSAEKSGDLICSPCAWASK